MSVTHSKAQCLIYVRFMFFHDVCGQWTGGCVVSLFAFARVWLCFSKFKWRSSQKGCPNGFQMISVVRVARCGESWTCAAKCRSARTWRVNTSGQVRISQAQHQKPSHKTILFYSVIYLKILTKRSLQKFKFLRFGRL